MPARRTDVDTVVVGAGPHALTVCAYLRKRAGVPPSDLAVVDSSGAWLARWNRRLAGLRLSHLRSPCVHHPDPDPFGLLSFAERDGHLDGDCKPPDRPLFDDFCRRLVHDLELPRSPIGAQVERLSPSARGIVAELSGGVRIAARRAVVATNPSLPHWPDWARAARQQAPPARICHADELRIDVGPVPPGRVLVVGGGLTAGHLAVMAAEDGARVTLALRRPLQVREFDTAAGWFTYRLANFLAMPDQGQRHRTVRLARQATVTPLIATSLRRLTSSGVMELREATVERASWKGDGWQVRMQGGATLECDLIWLGTGWTWALGDDPLLGALRRIRPTASAGGLPVLDDQLRWPATSIHVMGGMAALQLGAAAPNLSGARIAAERIVGGLVSLSDRQYPDPTRPYHR